MPTLDIALRVAQMPRIRRFEAQYVHVRTDS